MLLLSLNDKQLFVMYTELSQKSADSDTMLRSKMETVDTTSITFQLSTGNANYIIILREFIIICWL